MDRAEMVKQLVEMGFDEENLKSASDELLQQMLNLSEGDESESDSDEEFADLDMDAGKNGADKKDADAKNAEGDDDSSKDDHPSDDDVASMSEDEAKAKLMEYRDKAMKYSDDDKGDKKDDEEPAKNGEKGTAMNKATMGMFSEMIDKKIAAALEIGVNKQIERFSEFAKDTTNQMKRVDIEKFCEAMLKDGKITPADMDKDSGQPTIVDRLMACDATREVFKFSDGKGGTYGKTQLQVEMEAIEARMAKTFKEQVKPGDAEKFSEDVEVKKVEAHFEKFSERFAKLNTTKDEMVEAYKLSRKRKPELTAEDFLNVGRRSA